MWVRTKGTASGIGAIVGHVSLACQFSSVVKPVMTDSTGTILIASDTTGTEQAAVMTTGWYFPRGM